MRTRRHHITKYQRTTVTQVVHVKPAVESYSLIIYIAEIIQRIRIHRNAMRDKEIALRIQAGPFGGFLRPSDTFPFLTRTLRLHRRGYQQQRAERNQSHIKVLFHTCEKTSNLCGRKGTTFF